MPSILSRAKTVLLDMPGRGKLAYCLLRDERAPSATITNPFRRSGELRVLLTKDVENVGRAGDVKEVADGYGRNFLLRRKLAVAAGKGAEAEARRLREAAQKRETKDRTDAQAVAD